MAKADCGEVSLKVGAKTQRLRLDIGTMMDLEDYFSMGLIPFLANRLPEFRLKDIAALYLAMTGGDFTDENARKKTVQTIIKTGLSEVATAISECLEMTLSPEREAKPAGDKTVGKPKARKP